MNNINNILVIEPYCKNFEHVKFNSAFLALLLQRKNNKIIFLAEQNHLMLVKNNLKKYSNNIEFYNISIKWPNIDWAKYVKERRFIIKYLIFAKMNKYNSIIYLSTTSSMIVALKNILPNFNTNIKITVIPHAILEGLYKPSKRIWNKPLSIKFALNINTPSNLYFIALSEPIFESIKKLGNIKNWNYIEHPYIFDHFITNYNNISSKKIIFGIFGVLRNRLSEIYDIISKIKKYNPNVRFYIIGFIKYNKTIENLSYYFDKYSLSPITFKNYNKLGNEIDYAIYFTDPKHYEYVASNTILDILNFKKPGIFLKNKLIENYFTKIGKFGYMCNNSEEIITTIKKILDHNINENEYYQFINNIENNRSYFLPEIINIKVQDLNFIK